MKLRGWGTGSRTSLGGLGNRFPKASQMGGVGERQTAIVPEGPQNGGLGEPVPEGLLGGVGEQVPELKISM